MDVFKFNLTEKTVKKAARRLAEKNVKFRIVGTAIVVLAQMQTRNHIANVMGGLGAHTVPANDYDFKKLLE